MEKNERLEKIFTMTRAKLFSLCKDELQKEHFSLDVSDSYILARGALPVLVVANIYDSSDDKPSIAYTNDVVYSKTSSCIKKDRACIYATLEFAKKMHCSYLILGGTDSPEDDLKDFIADLANMEEYIVANFLLSFSSVGNASVSFSSAQKDFIDYVTQFGFIPSAKKPKYYTNSFEPLSAFLDLPVAAVSSGYIDTTIPHLSFVCFDSSQNFARKLVAQKSQLFSTLPHKPLLLREATEDSPALYEIDGPLSKLQKSVYYPDDEPEQTPTELGRYFKNMQEPFCIKLKDGTTEISESEFYDFEDLVGIEIPSSVTKIGHFAFAQCTHLKEIFIPDSVKTMGIGVFGGCYKLSNVRLPSHLKELPNNTFHSCENLNKVELPNSLRVIGDEAFRECVNLKLITLPTKLTSIGESAFENTGIESIQLPKTLTTIKERAFCECHSLKEIVVPESVTVLGTECFMKCTSLHTVKLSDSLTTIPSRCFALCNELSDVQLPRNLIAMGNGVFLENEALTTISIPESVRYIGRNAFNTTSLSQIDLPPNLLCIETGTFFDCEELISVTLHEGIEAIGEMAFDECPKLKKFLAPKSVQFISGGNDVIRKQR